MKKATRLWKITSEVTTAFWLCQWASRLLKVCAKELADVSLLWWVASNSFTDWLNMYVESKCSIILGPWSACWRTSVLLEGEANIWLHHTICGKAEPQVRLWKALSYWIMDFTLCLFTNCGKVLGCFIHFSDAKCWSWSFIQRLQVKEIEKKNHWNIHNSDFEMRWNIQKKCKSSWKAAICGKVDNSHLQGLNI